MRLRASAGAVPLRGLAEPSGRGTAGPSRLLTALVGLGLFATAPVLLRAEKGSVRSDIVLPGSAELPADAVRHCGGHVTGRPSPDRPGPHITWDAYISGEETQALAARFEESLGREPDATEGGCSTWRFPPEKPGAILELCPGSATGPWTRDCDPIPPETVSIIMASTTARAD